MNFPGENTLECTEVMEEVVEVIDPTQLDNKNSCASSKRKRQSTLQEPNKKSNATTKQEALLQCPISKLKEFCQTTLKKDIENEENALTMIDGLFEVEENQYSVHSIFVLIGLVCSSHLESLVHPQMWKIPSMQTDWEENLSYLIPNSTYQTLLTCLRQNLRTSYKSMDVRCILGLCLEGTDILVQWFCRMDVMELIDALRKLREWLDFTPLNTGTSTLRTGIMSTYLTSAATTTTVLDAFGSETARPSRNSDDLDFVELLEQSSSSHPTTSVSCDTYLQVLDSSKELVATPKMKDYVIDINIYRQVLKNYLMCHRKLVINENYYRLINIICINHTFCEYLLS